MNEGTDAVAILGVNFGIAGFQDFFFIPGDFDSSYAVDILDVAPFVDAILDSDYNIIADINQDCAVDLFDVQPFVDLLIGN